MTKLHQLHNRHGQSPWLDNHTRRDLTGGHPMWRQSETDVFPGQHD